MTIEARTLWSLSLFFFLLGALYWATAHEPAGVTLLMLCSAAAIVAALPVSRRQRRRAAEGSESATHAETYAGASLWPFIIGAGAVLVVNGLVLGPWLLVPGAALVVRGLIGVLGRAEPPPAGRAEPSPGPG